MQEYLELMQNMRRYFGDLFIQAKSCEKSVLLKYIICWFPLPNRNNEKFYVGKIPKKKKTANSSIIGNNSENHLLSGLEFSNVCFVKFLAYYESLLKK